MQSARLVRHLRRLAISVFVLCLAPASKAQSIFTVAGGGSDDGKLATEVAVFNPRSVALDAPGNIYFSEQSANQIRRVDAKTGTISTLAGNGGAGFSGDGGNAKLATLNNPFGIVFDRSRGDIYIADNGNGRVRKIDGHTGIINTIAGIGKERSDGTLGDNGPATEAVLRGPIGLALSGSALYISEWGYLGQRVRKLVLSTGTITTIAGDINGLSGDAGDGDVATKAFFNNPTSIAVDGGGNVFVADASNNRVRRIDATTAKIETYAGGGNPTDGIGDDGPATAAKLEFPSAIAIDNNGNLLVFADNGLRRVDKTTHNITTIARDLGRAYGIAVDANNNVLVTAADGYAAVIRVTGGVEGFVVVAGQGSFVGDGLLPGAAVLRAPQGVAIDSAGNLFIADGANRLVRRVDAKSGVITTVAGNQRYYDEPSDNGQPATSVPVVPVDVAIDLNGDLYIADEGNQRIKKVDAKTGVLTFVAGGGDPPGGINEGLPATSAKLLRPDALAFDAANSLYIADANANRVWKVDATTKTITNFAGNGKGEYSGDGAAATQAGIFAPTSIAIDANGLVYISDAGNYRLRRVNKDGTIQTIAGTGDETILTPKRLAIDRRNNDLYVSDSYSSRVKKVDVATGTLTTVVGSGTAYFIDAGFSGDNGPALDAKMNFPYESSGLAISSSGDIYIADTNNNRVRAVFACTSVSAPQLTGPAGSANVSTAPALSWSKVAHAFRYDVFLDTVSPPSKLIASDVDGTSFAPSNLATSTKYYWSVKAKGDPFCTLMSTATSAVSSFTTIGTCAAGALDTIAPTDGATTSSQSVQLTWRPSAGAKDYEVYFGSVSPPPRVASGVTATSYNVNVGSGKYYWFVVAHASCDPTKTASTAIRSFTSSAPSDCSPGQLRVTTAEPANGAANTSTSLDLVWASSGAPVTGYDVYFGTSLTPPLLNANVTATRQTVSGLVPATTYYWRVVAKNACEPNGVTSAVSSFTTRSCAVPGATSILFAPASVSAGTTYTIVWSPASGLDPDGGYLVERSTSASFAGIESQVTSSTAASFVATVATTYYHRVRAVAGCDPTKSGPISDGKSVLATTARANVIFTVQPNAVVTALGDKLEDRKGSFTLENLGTDALQVIVGRQELGSPPFFSIVDPQGSDVAFVTLEPRKPRTFEIRYSGPSKDAAASYQGVIFVASTGQGLTITPYAFVNLKVGGGVGASPRFLVGGVPTEYAAFPGYSGDDTNRPALPITLRNSGTAPMEMAAEIGPEVWLIPDPNWNVGPLAPGAERTVNLFTRRSRAPNGSALPRYTYFTVRTKDGATARLLVQDNDQIAVSAGRPIRLDPNVRSFIIPEVVSRTTSSGAPLVSRIRLSNVGGDAVQVELIFTPSGSDGFDAAVRRAVVVVPANDVATLTDPLVQIFSLTRPASGQIEVRIAPERLGLVGVTASVVAIGASGGFAIPTVNRGEGARLGVPHVLLGVSETSAATTSLLLAETGGIDNATLRAVLFDSGGRRVGESTYTMPRYGSRRIDNIATALGGANIDNGRIELTVESGGGSVSALGIVKAPSSDSGATFASRAVDEKIAGASLAAAFWKARPHDALPSVSTVVPVIGGPTSSGAAPAYKTTIGFLASATAAADFSATFRTSSGGTASVTRTVSVPAGSSRIYSDVVAELFGVPPGSQGSVFVQAGGGGKVYAVLQSATPAASAGPTSALPLTTNLSEALTSAASATQRPLFYDGLEQSVDSSRGSRWLLVMNEVGGASGIVNIRLYEAGNRTRPFAEKDVQIAPYQQLALDTVFGALGLEAADRKKDRTNVQVVVTATGGSARIAASAVSIDNKSGDTKVFSLAPSIGSATPSVSLVSPVAPPPPTPGRRRATKH